MKSGTTRSSDDKYYRALFENSIDTVLLTVPDGTIVAANPAACVMFGMSEKEICAAGREGLIDHTDPNHQKFQEEWKSTGKARGELIYRRKDGSRFIGDATSVILDGDTSAFVIVRDVTERKRAEEELQLTQFCVDKGSLALYQLTEEGDIWNVNECACQTLGYSMEELRSMTVFDIDPTLTREVFNDLASKLFARGPITFERVHRRKDGTTFPVEITANAVEFRGRKFGINFVKDITERRQADEALKESESRVRRKLESILDPEGDIGELDLADIIDLPQIQALMEELYRASGLKMSILDPKGEALLIDAGWQEICRKYHRGHPETRDRCRESDTDFTVGIQPGEFRKYKCKNNMWHLVTPIMVGGRHMGNLFISQFFFENEKIDYDLFRAQAKKYGFPEKEYIAALEAVPRYSEEFVDLGKSLFLRLIDMFSRLSYGNIKLARLLTERDRLTATLRESEARLKMAMDLAKLVQWEYDIETGMFIFDDQFYALYGTTAEREGGILMSAEDYAQKFIPYEESSVVSRGIAEVLASSSIQLEHRIIRADGEERFIVVRCEAVRDQTGSVIKIRGANQDITKRKQAEEALRLAHDELEKRVAERTKQLQETAEELRASEERYALAIQGSNDGIWDLNIITGEAYHSPRWKSILGYEDDEISCNISEWWSRIHPDDYHRVMETCKAYEEGRLTELRVEHRLRHKDGSYRWVLSRGACLRDSDGKSYRASGSLTDITERKKLEQQLLQSQKMESIGILAGGVAHDFNNLLTAISGYGQILLETIPVDDEVSLDNIRNVLKAADRAAELTRGLLAFSRKQTINPKPVHIDSLIGNAGKLIQRIIGEDIEFGTNFHDKNLLVEADPGQIEQVLMNLATNARDAMPDGGHLCITARQAIVEDGSENLFDLLSPGKYALISVSDTGIGIEKESLGKVFEPFYTTKGVGEGTGLGLSMVYGIIKQHNGSVLVDSEPGRGTRVDIYLPLIEGHAEVEKSKPAAPHAAGKETVLVVEDEEIVKDFMQKMLERAGYRVILADNGEDGVERFRENADISLVLSDMVMPRKNGRQMLDEIRRMKPGIKAVFMSGYTADFMQDKGILDDVTEFITKPVIKDDLLRKMRELLDKD